MRFWFVNCFLGWNCFFIYQKRRLETSTGFFISKDLIPYADEHRYAEHTLDFHRSVADVRNNPHHYVITYRAKISTQKNHLISGSCIISTMSGFVFFPAALYSHDVS